MAWRTWELSTGSWHFVFCWLGSSSSFVSSRESNRLERFVVRRCHKYFILFHQISVIDNKNLFSDNTAANSMCT